MAKYKAKIRIGLMVTLVVCVIFCPLAWGGYSVHYAALAQEKSDGPIKFTPHITGIVLTITPDTILGEDLGYLTAIVSGNTITIGTHSYPIGDGFLDGSDIPQGAVEQSLFGEYGYATILAQGADEYRLIWITDNDGVKHYMIVKEDDNLFNETDGFTEQLEKLTDNEEKVLEAIGLEFGGIGGLIVGEFVICPITGGAGCIVGLVTAFGAVIGGVVRGIWLIFHEWLPSMTNVVRGFESIEISRP